MDGKKVLLIISGGIAAVKIPDLIRKLMAQGAQVTPVLTRGGSQFVTSLSIAALARSKVYTDLWDLTDEAEMGHIELSRSADLILVAPATANIMAKMAQGLADDLATTLLLATDTPVMIVPSMNVRMWVCLTFKWLLLYYSILLVSYFLLSGALDNSALHLSHPMTSLASRITIILILISPSYY